jgi:hypothetical protein
MKRSRLFEKQKNTFKMQAHEHAKANAQMPSFSYEEIAACSQTRTNKKGEIFLAFCISN